MSVDKGKEIEAQLLVEQLRKIHRISQSDNPTDRQEATKNLGKIAGNVLGNLAVVDLSGCEVIADLMHTREAALQFEATKMLAGLSVNDRLKTKIASSKVVSTLNHIAYKGNVMVKRQVARVYAALSTVDTIKDQFVAQNALRPLNALVRFDNDEVRRQALRCVAQIATGKGNPVKIVASGVVPEIVELLKHPSVDVQAEAAAALAVLSTTEAAKEIMMEERALTALLEILATAQSTKLPDELVRDATCVIARIGLGAPVDHFETAKPAAAEKLVQLVVSTDMAQEQYAVACAAAFAVHPATRKMLLQAYALEPLTALARSGAYHLHLPASCALIHISLENAALIPLADESVRVITRTSKKYATLEPNVQTEVARILMQCCLLPDFKDKLCKDSDVAELYESLKKKAAAAEAGTAQVVSDASGKVQNNKSLQRWTALHEAACLGNTKLVKKLLETKEGQDSIEARDETQATPMHVAAMWGHAAIIELLTMASGKISAIDKQGRTPLHLSSNSGHLAASKMLLELNADPLAQDEELNSPLHLAAVNGHDEVVELLLSAGAAPFKRNKQNQTPYILAMDNNFFSTADILCNLLTAVKNGNFAALEYLLKTMGRDVNQRDEATGWTPLHQACAVGNLQMVKFLLERGAKIEMKTFSGLTCFHLAARSGSKEVIQFIQPLLKKVMPELEINSTGEAGKTAYIEACAYGHPALASWLVTNKGANEDAQDDIGFTGLHHSCANGHGECAGQLLDRGVNDKIQDKQGRTALEVATPEVLAYLKARKLNTSDLIDAIRKGDLEAVKTMIDGPAKMDVNKASGTTIPMHEAVKYGSVEIVKYLIEKGARMDTKDQDGNTLLHHAALVDSEPIVLALIKAGAPKYLKNNAGKTPYDLAVEKGARVVRYLVSLHEATRTENIKIIDTLAYSGENVNTIHPELGVAPIHIAGDIDSKKTVARLIKHGANPDLPDTAESEDTPAIRMCKKGHVNAMRALFEGMGDANKPDAYGRSPLHHAIDRKQVKAAAVLVEYGGAKNQPDKSGVTPLQLAQKSPLAAEFNKVFTNLHLASAGGILADIVEIVENGADGLVNSLDADGRTPLHYAARRDQAEVVEYLLGEGAEIEVADREKLTPFLVACLHGASEAAVTLMDAEANIQAVDKLNRTAWLLGAQGGLTIDVLEALQSAGLDVKATDSAGNNAFHHAAIGGQIHVLEHLLEHDIVPYIKNADGRTAYDLAVEHGNIECAVMLSTIHRSTASGDLEVVEMQIRNGANLAERDDNGETPLNISSRLGFWEISSALVWAGADPHAADKNGESSVHLAAGSGHVKALIALFERSGVDSNIVNRSKATPLHVAARNGHAEACRVLLGYGADPSRVDADGNTPFMLAILNGHKDAANVLGDLHRCLASGNKKELEMMLKAGIGINALNAEGLTALHVAVKNNDIELATYLLDHGVDKHVRDKNGNTPLHLAVELQNIPMIELLIKHGADPNFQNTAGDTSLHVAVRVGRKDIIQMLLKAGAKTNIANNAGQTPYQLALVLGKTECASLVGNLHAAVIGGDLSEIASLLDNGAQINSQDEQGWTPLHHAVYLGSAEIAKMLISRGADVNIRDNAGETALHLAAMCGSLECARMLVDANTDINVRDAEGCTPLILACASGEVAVARFLLEKGADSSIQDNAGYTCLHHAVLNGHVDVVRMLLEHGVRSDILSNDGHSALHLAMAGLRKDCVALLVDISAFVLNGDLVSLQKWLDLGASANTRDKDGCTPLHIAARVGAADICKALIKAGAAVDIKDNAGNTPLHLAALHDHDGCVGVLLEAKANPNAQDFRFRSPLQHAVFRQNVAICARLVAANANVDAQDVAGWSSLHLGAYADAYDVVKVLLRGKANRHLKNADGYTPCDYAIGKRVADLLLTLHDSAAVGDIDEGKRLLAILAGAQINVRDEVGFTAMHIAALHGQDAYIRFLLDERADATLADRNGQNALHAAATKGRTACGITLIDRAHLPVNGVDSTGRTALMLAVAGGHDEFAKMLIARGADLNMQDKFGNTALHYAMMHGHVELARALVAAGARTDIMNINGETPYMMAYSHGFEQCANLISDLLSACKVGNINHIMEMISAGMDPNMRDLTGSSALHEACRRGLAEVVRALIKAGAMVDITDKDGATPLHVSFFNGQMECANILLEAGASIDIRLLDGGTVLHTAAAGGFVPCAEVCLQRGINVNATDNKGRTPLHLAALFGHADMVDFLLRNGADITAEDFDGFTALNYALRAGPAAQRALDVLMKWFEDKRSEAERLAELEYARRAADFEDDSIFEVAGDEMNVVLQVQQLQRLIRFAHSDDVEEQHQAARSLTNLSTNAVNQPRIVQAGGLILLNKLSNSPYAAVQFQSLRALANLASHEDNKMIMVEGESLETLKRLGKTGPNVAVKRQTTRALANLASHDKTKELMVKAGVLDALIHAAYCDTALECQRQAARAFASLSRAPEVQVQMISEGVLEALMVLTKANNDRISLQVAWAFGNLSENYFNQESIVELGAVPFLAKCLRTVCADADKDIEPMLHLHAVRALRFTAQRPENHHAIMDCDGLLADIIKMTAVEDPEPMAHALACIMGLASDVRNRDPVRWAGGLDPLLLNTHHEDEKVRLYSCGGILYFSAKDKRTPEQKQQHESQMGPPPVDAKPCPNLDSAKSTAVSVLQALKASESPEVSTTSERLLAALADAK